MRLLFWRRRLDDFADAVRPELQAMPTPQPSPDLLDRILASRAAGTRTILPEPFIARRPRTLGRAVVAAAVVALLLLVIVPSQRRDAATSVASPAPFSGTAAFAQTSKDPEGPSLPPASVSRAGSLRPLALEFARRTRSADGGRTETTSSLSVRPAVVDSTPAWHVVAVRRDVLSGQPRTDTETLYVARADLRLLRRAVHVSPYRRWERISIRQQFSGDSLTGRMTTDGPSIGRGRGIARRMPPEFAPYTSDAMAPVFLMAVPMSRTWRGSVSLLGWAVVDDDFFTAAELRVEGDERMTVPAGTFDCWRLSIRFDGRQITYWVRKSDGLGVRMLDDLDADTRGTREVVLTRIGQ